MGGFFRTEGTKVEFFERGSYGPSVSPEGGLRFTSVSQLKTAQRCLLKWWWEKIQKKPTPQTKAQRVGIELEDEWYSHLRTGTPLSPMAFVGKPFQPTGKLLLQKPLATLRDGKVTSPVMAGTVPLVGYLDILTAEGVIDIKTTSDPKWAKTPFELTQDLQMVGYAKFHQAHYQHDNPVPVTHWYFKTRTPYKSWAVRAVVNNGQSAQAWSAAESVVLEMAEAAKVPTAKIADIPANTKACADYGGCPHRAYCPEGAKASVLALFGSPPTIDDTATQKENDVTPQGKLSPATQAAIKELKAKQQQQTNTDGIRAAHLMDAIGKRDWGVPPLAGDIATLFQQAKGLPVTGSVPGTDRLADIAPVTTLDDLLDIARELDVPEEVRAWAPSAKEAPVAVVKAATPAPVAVASIVPPDAPATKIEPGERRGRGRPKKIVPDAPAQPEHIPVEVVAPEAAPIVQEKVTRTGPAVQAPSAWALYINCMPLNAEPKPLYPYVLKVWAAANKTANAPDVRLVEKNSPLAYGGWRGAISALVVSSPPEPGAYYIDTAGTEITDVIAHAVAQVVMTAGGPVVQGIR